MTVNDIPAGAITTADLYRKLEQMGDLMVRLDERVSVLPDHEARLRLLEKFRYTLMGVAAAAGMLSGVATGIITSVLAARH